MVLTRTISKHNRRCIVLDPLAQADDEHQRVLDRTVIDTAGQHNAVVKFSEWIKAPAMFIIHGAYPVVAEAVLGVEASIDGKCLREAIVVAPPEKRLSQQAAGQC